MIPDAYTILLARSVGWLILAIVSAIGYALFYFTGYPNGISRLFGLCLLAMSMVAVMVSSTGLAVILNQNLSSELLNFYYWYWIRETAAVWLLNLIIVALGIYLMRHKDD